MKHVSPPLWLGLSLLLVGCDRSNSITRETSSGSSAPPSAPAASADVGARGADRQQEEPKAGKSANAPPKAEQKGKGDSPEAAEAPAPELVPTRKAAPETVKVRGKEYPYCRAPNEEGCISRKSRTQAPVWK